MKATLSNSRTGSAAKNSLGLVLPAVLCIVGAMGITAKHRGDLKGIRERFESNRQTADDLASQGGLDEKSLERMLRQIENERSHLRSLFPGAVSSVDLYSILRMTTEASGLTVNTIELLDPVDLELESRGESLMDHGVRIRGDGPLPAAMQLIATLRSNGIPVAVRTFSFSRQALNTERFDIALELALFYHDEPIDDADADDDESEEEELIPGG